MMHIKHWLRNTIISLVNFGSHFLIFFEMTCTYIQTKTQKQILTFCLINSERFEE